MFGKRIAVTAALVACRPSGGGEATPSAPPVVAQPVQSSPALERLAAAMDIEAKPCESFYRYACGRWLDATADEAARHPVSLVRGPVEQRNMQAIGGIIARAAAERDGDRQPRGAIARFHGACMARREHTEHPRMTARFAEIDLAEDRAALMRQLAHLHGQIHGIVGRQGGCSPLFALHLTPDFEREPVIGHLELVQAHGCFGPREAYLRAPPPRREHYVGTIEMFLAEIGGGDAESRAKAVFQLESRLAAASVGFAEIHASMAGPPRRVSADELDASFAGLELAAYLDAAGNPAGQAIFVRTPSYLNRAGTIVAETELPVLRDYLKWSLAMAYAAHSGADWAVRAQKAPRPSPQPPETDLERCNAMTVEFLPAEVGRAFIAEHFSADARAGAQAMSEVVKSALAEHLARVPWMDEATRLTALQKAAGVRMHIAYPDAWPRDVTPQLAANDHLTNVWNIASARAREAMATVGAPWTPDAWPPIVPVSHAAAAFTPTNAFFMTAGFLQPPVFDLSNPAAMNFGAAGVILGHEISHAFDDHGRRRMNERDFATGGARTRPHAIVERRTASFSNPRNARRFRDCASILARPSVKIWRTSVASNSLIEDFAPDPTAMSRFVTRSTA